MNREVGQNGAIVGNVQPQTVRALVKWLGLGLIGIGCLVFAIARYFRQDYTWVLAASFVGCFLTSAAWKKVHLLIIAGRALKAGAGRIIIFYRDKNLKASQDTVIPVWADAAYLYGFLTEKKDIKVFRWERILRALEHDQEIDKDTLLQRIAGHSARTKTPR